MQDTMISVGGFSEADETIPLMYLWRAGGTEAI